jgi:hypothetical protein
MCERPSRTINRILSETKIVLEFPQRAHVRRSNIAGQCIRICMDNRDSELTVDNDKAEYSDPIIDVNPRQTAGEVFS